jgi:hypothetical protein
MKTLESNPIASRVGASEGGVSTNRFAGKLEITVIFTNIPDTLCATRTASRLAAGLGAELRIIVPQAARNVVERLQPGRNVRLHHLRTIAGHHKIATRIDIHYCQNRSQMLQEQLSPGSIVVLGGRRHWWQTPESRLAQRLRSAGHTVLFCERQDGAFCLEANLLSDCAEKSKNEQDIEGEQGNTGDAKE